MTLLYYFSHPAFLSMFISLLILISPREIIKMLALFGIITVGVFSSYVDSVYIKSILLSISIAFTCGIFYSFKVQNYKTELSLAFLYLGNIIGTILNDDLWYFFTFFELASISAAAIIFINNFKNAKQSAYFYFLIHFASGLILLYGLILAENAGIQKMSHLLMYESFAQNLVIASMIINLGAFPFSFWITETYPKASISGMIFLSCLTTKIAAFYIIMLTDGENYLLYIGIATIIYSSIYLLLEENIKRFFCFISINSAGSILIVSFLAPKIYAISLLSMSIIYTSLGIMFAGYLAFNKNIHTFEQVKHRLSFLDPISIPTILIITSFLGLPFSINFIAKSLTFDFISMDYKYLGKILDSSHIIMSLPLLRIIDLFFFSSKKISSYEAKITRKTSYTLFLPIFFLISSNIIFGIFPPLIFKLQNFHIRYFYSLYDIIHLLQLLAASLAIYFALRRFILFKNTPSFEYHILIAHIFNKVSAIIFKIFHIIQNYLIKIILITWSYLESSIFKFNYKWRVNNSASLSIYMLILIFIISILSVLISLG